MTIYSDQPCGAALPSADLLGEILRACAVTGMTHSRFGRVAVADPRLVSDLRNGRELRPATARTIRRAIAAIGGR